MARPIHPVNLSPNQQAVLERFVKRGQTPQWLHQRSQIILMAAQGESNRAIGTALHLNENTVGQWRQRWQKGSTELTDRETKPALLEQGIRELLADQQRPGSPARFTPEQICRIIALACEKPPPHLSHWSQSELARAAVERGIVDSISKSSIERFLKSAGFKASPSPVLAEP
ncbi:MAG: helix-turn-helix domain-containing protein [Thiolinea sp.]